MKAADRVASAIALGWRAISITLGVLALALPLPGRAADLAIAMTPSPFSLPLDIAEAQGYFAAEGVKVRMIECNSGQRCMQLMLDGVVHIAFASELPVVFTSFRRADYAILATVATSTTNIKVVARRSAGIAKPAELKGRKVGVIVGSSAHYFLDAFLLFHGVDPKRVRVVSLSPEELSGAVERREVDAIVGHSRHAGPAAKALGADAIEFEAPHLYTDSYNLIVMRETATKQEAELVKVLRALARAEQFIATQPRAAKDMMRRQSKLDRGFAEAIFPGFNYRLTLDHSLVSTMEGEARWATREGHVPSDSRIPNYLEYVDPAPLRKAVPAIASK